jgi:hypothetical protein
MSAHSACGESAWNSAKTPLYFFLSACDELDCDFRDGCLRGADNGETGDPATMPPDLPDHDAVRLREVNGWLIRSEIESECVILRFVGHGDAQAQLWDLQGSQLSRLFVPPKESEFTFCRRWRHPGTSWIEAPESPEVVIEFQRPPLAFWAWLHFFSP